MANGQLECTHQRRREMTSADWVREGGEMMSGCDARCDGGWHRTGECNHKWHRGASGGEAERENTGLCAVNEIAVCARARGTATD